MRASSRFNGRVIPAAVPLQLSAPQRVLQQLAELVAARRSREEIHAAIHEARAVAADLDRRAPGANLLVGNWDLPRHLDFAERSRCVDDDYPDAYDMGRLPTRDFSAAASRVLGVVAEAERAAVIRAALVSLETDRVEYKVAIPPQTTELAQVFAGLAPRGGTVLLGVADGARPIGLPMQSLKDLDVFEARVRGIAQAVDPPISVACAWAAIDELVVAEVEVLLSGEPIHYVQGRPYIRDGSHTRLAVSGEVRRAILEHEHRRPLLRIEPSSSLPVRDQSGLVVQTFAQVHVINVGRARATVRAEARFFAEDGRQLDDGPMPLRWSATPEPLTPIWTPGGIQYVVNLAAIPLSYTIEVEPGDSVVSAVAIRFSDGTWGWTGESYAMDFRHPRWKLPDGPCLVQVTASADGRQEMAQFWLDTVAPLESFQVRFGEETVTDSTVMPDNADG